MVVKNNKIQIIPVFNMASCNLVYMFLQWYFWISFVILVVMVTIFVGKYGLLSYQHTYICNLVCVFTMIVWISFVILVVMVTIFVGKYGLPSYQHTYIYKMQKCNLLAIATETIRLSTEPSGYQHSEIIITFLKYGLWTDLSSKKWKMY